jgi:hypothetical protein
MLSRGVAFDFRSVDMRRARQDAGVLARTVGRRPRRHAGHRIAQSNVILNIFARHWPPPAQ